MPPKRYTTFTLERHVSVPRQVLWDTLLEFLGGEATGGYVEDGDPAPHGPGSVKRFVLDDWELTEVTLSLEPNWRRVYEITSGAPVALYQGTIALRDDGPESHLAWSGLIDPLPDGASDRFIERAPEVLGKAADVVVAMAEARPHGPLPEAAGDAGGATR